MIKLCWGGACGGGWPRGPCCPWTWGTWRIGAACRTCSCPRTWGRGWLSHARGSGDCWRGEELEDPAAEVYQACQSPGGCRRPPPDPAAVREHQPDDGPHLHPHGMGIPSILMECISPRHPVHPHGTGPQSSPQTATSHRQNNTNWKIQNYKTKPWKVKSYITKNTK